VKNVSFEPGVKNEETRNAWQSLAYSPLGAVVHPQDDSPFGKFSEWAT